VLILDEPTSLLAPAQADALLKWIRQFAETGRTVVLITHKIRDAIAVADTVTVLRHGRTVLTGEMSAYHQRDLLSAMLGSPGGESPAVTTHSQSARTIVSTLQAVCADDPVHRERIVDVSLEVRGGEIVGLAGLERSGHRILLRVLAGRHQVTSGSAHLPVDVAFIPEDVRLDALASTMDLSENVAIRGAAQRSGWYSRRMWSSATRGMIREFDIRAPSERIFAGTLSGGNQQRLVLARELAGEPALIIAENPTRGLDARATDEVHQRLRNARASGSAVVFYSSDVDELVSECDRILVMYAGHLTAVERSPGAIGRALLGAQGD
jgi:simple sugar transport system ATP-binding protein